MPTVSATLTVMIRAARKAARGLLRDFNEVENLQVSRKGAADFVSRADIKAEEVLKEELLNARPNYGWLGEETGAQEGKDPTRRWIVDPLDGTTNFLHAIPHWAVSVALEHKGEVVAAVVLDAAKDEIYAAEKGAGAWLNDQRIRVSSRSEMTECLFGSGMPFAGKGDLPETLQDMARLMPRCAGMRRNGAAALDLAWVAAGRLDGFWERRLQPWDIAAGILLVREAGGFVQDLNLEEADPLKTGSVIASNSEVFNRFAKVLRT